jgi:hypothetical protein
MENPPALYAQWIMKLQPYDIDIIYKKGKLHGNADTLSRRPPTDQDPDQETPTKRVSIKEKLGKGPPFTELI